MATKPQAISAPELASVPAAKFFYNHAVRHGSQLWISGQVSMNANGDVVGEGDITWQAEQVFENLSAVVRAAGGDLSHMVSTTTYVTDRSLLLPVNEVRGRYLASDPAPTSTLLVVAGLARPGFLLEISAIAVLPE
ncbi:RidA family protein [Streptomyces lunaelactis]|uniref:RidA family protein n=1 Tax=Streptomyces lunaelactis TaxID=1535768 RepID=UPI00158513B3|nr:RidA family protein [Streptomyces lunaelactis]NUK53183.1 RidA family protein [Streptomyces lunaelactis]NUK66719.1 RidA family protein [Streptomyces lunaelactis]